MADENHKAIVAEAVEAVEAVVVAVVAAVERKTDVVAHMEPE